MREERAGDKSRGGWNVSDACTQGDHVLAL